MIKSPTFTMTQQLDNPSIHVQLQHIHSNEKMKSVLCEQKSGENITVVTEKSQTVNQLAPKLITGLSTEKSFKYHPRPNITNLQFISCRTRDTCKGRKIIVNNFLVSHGEKKLTFDISGISYQTAVTLMRTIKSEVPIMAIDEVAFETNTTGFHEEFIAQRLSLVPLSLNPDNYEFPHVNMPLESPLKPKYEILSLEACNRTNEILSLTSILLGTKNGQNVSSDKIIIVPLIPGAKISFKAKVIKGIGREHAKWSSGDAHYTADKNKNFHFVINSRSFMSAPLILIKALEILSDPPFPLFNQTPIKTLIPNVTPTDSNQKLYLKILNLTSPKLNST